MDQCIFCSSRGDIKKCENTFCSYHDSWYAETLLAKLAASEQRVKALEEALQKVRDRFFQANQPERDRDILWDEVNEALEATCQK